jgi:hypothetical protein
MKKVLLLLAISLPMALVTSCGPTEEELKEADKKMEPEKIENKQELQDLNAELGAEFEDASDSAAEVKAK